MGAPINRLLALASPDNVPQEADRDALDRGYVYRPQDIEALAMLDRRPPQQEPGEGRLPTTQERAGGNPLKAWWLGQGDKMRSEAAKPQSELWRQFGVQALTAPLGARFGLEARGPLPPEPFTLPGGGFKGPRDQPLHFDGGGHDGFFQYLLPPLGAWAGKTRAEDEVR